MPDDGIDEAGDAHAVEQVTDEAAAADHGARRDGGGRVSEGELEHPERQQRHARRAVGRGQALQAEARRADPRRARLEHEGEAPEPERDPADAGVGDPLDEDVDRLARAREPRLEHHEALRVRRALINLDAAVVHVQRRILERLCDKVNQKGATDSVSSIAL